MATKLGLIADVHASPAPLKQALSIFKQQNISDIICVGDIAGYFESLAATVDLLIEYNCTTIIGNHDQSYIESSTADQPSRQLEFLKDLPETLELEVEHKRVYVVHAQPPASQHGGIKLLDQFGNIIPQQKQHWRNELKNFEYDVLIVGHTHQVFAEQLGDVMVINPGSSTFNHSCMILTLPDLKVQTYALDNQEILKSWNFSMLFSHHSPYPAAKSKH